MVYLPPEVNFLVSKIRERSAIKEQYASRYFVRIDGEDYTVRARSADIDPITITTDDKKCGMGGFILPTGAGPATFQGEILEDEQGTTHKKMSELASRVMNSNKTANLPYDSKYGKGYIVDLVVGFYGLDGSENLDISNKMYITSEKISFAADDDGALWIPVEFTQFIY